MHLAAAAPESTPVIAPVTSRPARLVSLDAFRGLTMAGMVVVNNPGTWSAVYAPLLHAEWHGWTPTDLIFPFFLFIVGVSATLSKGTAGPWGRILRRTAVIAGLGLLLAGFPRFPFATWRIPGVLQRIALCYLAAVAIYRWLTPRDRSRVLAHGIRLGGTATVLLLVYWAVLTLVPVPGGGAGNLTPEGNVGAFVDRALMGQHLWRRRPWDPEGLLSTLPAIGTTLLGMIAGLWLGSAANAPRKVHLLVRAGLVGIIVGLAWDIVFPINKNLWTSSYAVFTGRRRRPRLRGVLLVHGRARVEGLEPPVRRPRPERHRAVRCVGPLHEDSDRRQAGRPGRHTDHSLRRPLPGALRSVGPAEARVAAVRVDPPRAALWTLLSPVSEADLLEGVSDGGQIRTRRVET